MESYPKEHSGFILKIEHHQVTPESFMIVAMYTKVLSDELKAIGKISKEVNGKYVIECGIRNKMLQYYENMYKKETKDTEEEAKKSLFDWIVENRLRLMFQN